MQDTKKEDGGNGKQVFQQAEDGCWNCKHWRKFSDSDNPNGLCTESCPQCVALPQIVPMLDKKSMLVGGEVRAQTQWMVNGYFPPTGPNVYCGKHRPKVN